MTPFQALGLIYSSSDWTTLVDNVELAGRAVDLSLMNDEGHEIPECFVLNFCLVL